jgi:hypothetical protein
MSARKRTAAQPQIAAATPEPRARGLRYDATLNPTGRTLPGVPLGDLTAEELAALPAWLRRSMAATGWWSPITGEEQTA